MRQLLHQNVEHGKVIVYNLLNMTGNGSNINLLLMSGQYLNLLNIRGNVLLL